MNSSSRRWILIVTSVSILLVSVPSFVLWRQFGSLAAARAFVRGDQVAILPAEVELEACDEGDVQETQVQVVNLTSEPIMLTGMHTSCSCVAASSLPAKLEAHAMFPLRITIHSPEQAGAFRRDATLYTDSQVSPRLPIEITGYARAVAAPGAIALRDEAHSDGDNGGNQDSTPDREPDLALSREASNPGESK